MRRKECTVASEHELRRRDRTSCLGSSGQGKADSLYAGTSTSLQLALKQLQRMVSSTGTTLRN